MGSAVLFVIVLLLCLPGYCKHFWVELVYFSKHFPENLCFLEGFAAYVPVHFVLNRFGGKPWEFIKILEHEITHAFFSLAFFRIVTRLVATSRGGCVSYRGNFGGVFGDIAISLAPYVCPTFTIIMALIRPVLPSDKLAYVDAVIGFTLGFHTLTTISETVLAFKYPYFANVDEDPARSDMAKMGFVFSTIYIIFFTVFYHGVVLCQLRGTFSDTWGFIKSGALAGWDLTINLFFVIQRNFAVAMYSL